ncbi:MAG: UDP-2,3-diacylglucosamine diphosphatase LpxG [Chlamydiales bacterium]
MPHKSTKTSFKDILWELFCLSSIVGIWPRHIEPRLVRVTEKKLPIHDLDPALEGFSLLHFSDLHLSPRVSQSYLAKLIETIQSLNPDLIVFTGDFINYSTLDDAERLKRFLCSFDPLYGCYAVYGNHDYAQPVSVDEKGDYALLTDERKIPFNEIFKRLARQQTLSAHVTDKVKQIPFHSELHQLIQKTPFRILENETIAINVQGATLNITGLGEHMLGRSDPQKAFANYQLSHPGIILSHNPDSLATLQHYPGDLILCGHTHGCQVNIPWIRARFTLMEHWQYRRGFISLDNKIAYVTTGVGASFPFRWFAQPEVALFTLTRKAS